MEKHKAKTIGFVVFILFLLSLSLFILKQVIFFFVQRTNFSDRMASMAAMTLLTGILLGLSRKRKAKLSVFPNRFTVPYVCASVLFGVLLIANPPNFHGGIKPVLLLAYSSIVTPVFEELIFRGYIWNKLNDIFTREWVTYLTTTILFALWHLAYIDSIAFRVDSGLLHVMLWKVITGLCFGIVLGAVRFKTRNCYSTILLHGGMNLFGR